MSAIQRLSAIEILDSRGSPTIQASCELRNGTSGTVSMPSGASTGKAEAAELRDGDARRYRGLGCRTAVANINDEVNAALAGKSFPDQADFDDFLIKLDGTAKKSRLGANAILAVSLAFARATAYERRVPLFLHFSEMAGQSVSAMPRPLVNLFSGGKHAGGQVPIQDVMIVPASAQTIGEALSVIHDIYHAAAGLCRKIYGMRTLTADEGGLAPPFPNIEAMLGNTAQAIETAGLRMGPDAVLAIDVAASHFYRDGAYHLAERTLTSELMIEQVLKWLKPYPVFSIEDGLAEDDWASWPKLRKQLSGKALTVGDDLLCTNPARIKRAIELQAADCLLLKVNQVGTVSEAIEALKAARSAGWQVTASARSGETEDNWLADLAVGFGADHIKIGSIRHSDRLAKYNRLLEIEQSHRLPLVRWPMGSGGPSKG